MTDTCHAEHQIRCVTNFEDLVSMPYRGEVNAICWRRELSGDFGEIAEKIKLNENIAVLGEEELLALGLSDEGQIAREVLLQT